MADLSAEQWWGTEARTVALSTAANIRRKDTSIEALLADAAKIEAWLTRPKPAEGFASASISRATRHTLSTSR